jgi:hypothetical protein
LEDLDGEKDGLVGTDGALEGDRRGSEDVEEFWSLGDGGERPADEEEVGWVSVELEDEGIVRVEVVTKDDMGGMWRSLRRDMARSGAWVRDAMAMGMEACWQAWRIGGTGM